MLDTAHHLHPPKPACGPALLLRALDAVAGFALAALGFALGVAGASFIGAVIIAHGRRFGESFTYRSKMPAVLQLAKVTSAAGVCFYSHVYAPAMYSNS